MPKGFKTKKTTSLVERQHGDYQLKEKDTKKEKRGSGSSRKKNTSSESSQSELTVSTKSTTTLDVSRSGETPQDSSMVTVEDYFDEPKKAGSSRSRETSLSSTKVDSSLSSQTAAEKLKPNPAHKETASSKEMKKISVEHPSSPLVPRGELSAQSELVEKCKALQCELEVVKNERDRANKYLEDERAKTDKFEEDRRAIIDEKEEVKKENEKLKKKLKNEMFENKSGMNHHEAEKTHQKSTDPSLPECDEGSGYHSLPEQHGAELNGKVGMQRHYYFHHKKVEQNVKALEDKTRHSGYDVEACVSPVRPQVMPVTLKEDLEERLKEKEEEISRLNQTITELRQSEQTQDMEESTCVLASWKDSDQLEDLRKEVGRLKNKNYEQKKTLSATNDELRRQLQEEETSHQQQLQSLKEELSRLQGENKVVKTERVVAQSDVKPLQAQETSHEEELMSLRKDLDRLQEENKQLKAENRKLEASISGLLISTRQRLDRHCEEQADKQQQMEPLQKENEELKADKTKLLKSFKDQLLTANNRIGELDCEKAVAHQQVKLLEEKIEELEANRGELQDQLRSANQQRDKVCAEKVRLQDQVKSLRGQSSKYPGVIAELKDELKSTNRRVTKLEEELDSAKEEIEARIQHEAKITREFRTCSEDKGRLEKKIETLQDQYQALQVQLDVNRADFEQERNDRASAAGRYADQEQELRETIKITGEELGRKAKEAREIGIERDRLKAELLQLKEMSITNKRQLNNLREQLNYATASSQGLEVKLQKQETQYHQLEQQLRREINDLKRQNANLTREIARKNQMRVSTSPHRSGHEDRYQGQLGKEGEDVDFLVGTLRSENSFLKEENKRLQSNFDDQYQMMSQKFLDSQRTVTELQQQMRDLQEQQIPQSHLQVLNDKYLTSQRRVSELEQEIRDLREGPIRQLPNQAVIQRGMGGPVNPKRQNVPTPLEFNHRIDEVERDSHSNSPRAHHNVPHPGSNYGFSDGVQYRDQNTMDYRLEGNFPQVSPLADRNYQRGVVGDTSPPPLDVSGSLPSPMHLPVQHSLSSDSETSFQPNRRYIGDGINREIRHEARQYKKAAEQGVPAPDSIDENVWPFDPNLECPHCGKRFRRGQIREYRYHLDDEHAPSLT